MNTASQKIYITSPKQNLNFTSDDSIASQTTIIYCDKINSSPTITLPHYQTVGTTIVYHLSNQQPIGGQNMVVKSPVINNNQMDFRGKSSHIENPTTLNVPPNETATVVIMNKNYTVMEFSHLQSSVPVTYPSQTYQIPEYITPNQIIAKPGLTIDNFVCKRAFFTGKASGSRNGRKLKIASYQQTTTTSSWLFYIWHSPNTKMMLVEFASTGNPNEIIVKNYYTGYTQTNATGSSSAAINAWKSLSSTKQTGSDVTAGEGYIVKNLDITVNNPTSNAPIPTIPQPFSSNETFTLQNIFVGTTITTTDLPGLEIYNVVCLSATFGGSAAGSAEGNALYIILYQQTQTNISWLFSIWQRPYTKMILVQFVQNGANGIKVNSLAAGYVQYDATVSETALKNAWNSKKSSSPTGYTVNNLTISTITPTPSAKPILLSAKPILHWVNSWSNCGGIPGANMTTIDNYDNFTVGKSLEQWGCENYSTDMEIVQISVCVPHANSFTNPPSSVSPGGVFVVEPTPETAYLDTNKYCSGNPNQNIYINASSSLISTTDNSNKEQCENLCSNDADCEMYLMSNPTTCKIYKNVSDVKMYCHKGSNHAYYGNVKIQNSLNENNIVELNQITPPTYPSQSYTLEGYITPNQIIAKPGLTIDNFVCESANFAGSMSPSATGGNLNIILYEQTTTSSSWLFYIWNDPYTKMMLVEFAIGCKPNEIIVNNFYTAFIKSNVTLNSMTAKNTWDSLTPTKQTGLYVTSGKGYIVNNLQIRINNPKSNVIVRTIRQPSYFCNNHNATRSVSGALGVYSSFNLHGVTVNNVVCLSATFGGSAAGSASGNALNIILYDTTSNPLSCSWLFYIWDSPYTKMILVQFLPNGKNSIRVSGVTPGHVQYDATVSETALKYAWESKYTQNAHDYTVNNLTITTSFTESFEPYYNESDDDDYTESFRFI